MIFEVKDLRFAYHRHEVLKGVSFQADVGDFICLLGENGAGKTTLFRCMLGLLRGYKGEIFIEGESIAKLSARQMARKVAYIPQAHSPAFNYTVIQTVLMGTSSQVNAFRAPGKEQLVLAEQNLERLGISHLKERGYAEISGGERQLVLIARALAQQSKVLIMDEPTANLDYGNQIRVMEQIQRLAIEGYLILLSTHNPEHALLYSHKVLVMRNGKTDLFGETRSTLTQEIIADIYKIPVKVYEFQTPEGVLPVCAPGTWSEFRDIQG